MRSLVLLALPLLLLRPCHPARAPQSGREIRVFVLGDGYEVANACDFERIPRAIEAAFANLPGAGEQGAAKLTLRKRLLTAEKTGESRLGLEYNGDIAKCYFTYDKNTLARIKVLIPPDFQPDRIFVALAGSGGRACAAGDLVFAHGQVRETTIAHEMGHSFAGLFDESGYRDAEYRGCVRWRNCATDAANPPWPSAIGSARGCMGYQRGIYHPAGSCRMGNTESKSFCDVCAGYLQLALTNGLLRAELPEGGGCDKHPLPARPWEGAIQGRKGLDVTAIVSADGRMEVVGVTPARPEARVPQIITGDTFAVIYDAEKIVGVTPLPMDAGSAKLTARAYSPGGEVFEQRVGVASTLLRFTVLDIDDDVASGHELRMSIRTLPRAREFFVVDEKTVAQLGIGATPPEYDLQEALLQYSRRR